MTMKQSKLLDQVLKASLSHNSKKLEQLRKVEFKKIIAHKAKGKSFSPKWTAVNF